MGGMFLWPKGEPWPLCDSLDERDFDSDWEIPDGAKIPRVPVVQLTAEDFPELQFFPGTNVMQLLWAPFAHASPTFVAKPTMKWRDSKQVRQQLEKISTSKHANPTFIPRECRLFPERIMELPSLELLSDDLRQKLASWDVSDISEDGPEDLYFNEFSAAPGIKVGGYARWIQDPEVPNCPNGHPMTHLLTLDDSEFDGGTKARWCPVEDREIADGDDHDARLAMQGPAVELSGGRQFIFVCRECDNWPIASVYQR